jgi:outer membrane lipoprotein-sorting protein
MKLWTFIKVALPPPTRRIPAAVPDPNILSKRGVLTLAVLLVPALLTARSQAADPPRAHTNSAAPSVSEKNAARLLRRALLSTSQLVFSGEQTLLTFDESDGAACVTQETHLGPGRYRIVYKNPIEAQGRIEIADGTWRQTYLPPTHTVVKTRVIDPPLTAADADARIARIQQRYRLRLAPKPELSEERLADRLEVRPRKPDRPWQRLWIDRATGLILRRESYRSDGMLVAQSSWSNLHFGEASPTALRWTPPPARALTPRRRRRVSACRRRARCPVPGRRCPLPWGTASRLRARG